MITKWLSGARGKTDTGGYQRAGKYGVVRALPVFVVGGICTA